MAWDTRQSIQLRMCLRLTQRPGLCHKCVIDNRSNLVMLFCCDNLVTCRLHVAVLTLILLNCNI